MYLLFYLHLTESLYQLTTQNKVMTITTLHHSSDNPATTRRSPGPNRLWTQQFGEFAFSLKKPFSAYFDYARLIFRSQFFLFASRISTIFAIYAVRYRRFAFANFVAYLRGNPCFAALIFVSVTSFCLFRAFVGVCEGWIDLCSISSSLARKETSLCGRSNSRGSVSRRSC